MKSREWFLVIIILILGQLLLHYWTTSAMSAVEVINYISFAGTIVSIILAVLAIIYAFYQSYSQQNNVDSISREVENLKFTATKISESAKDIGNVSTCLPKIMDDISELPAKINCVVEQLISEKTQTLLDSHGSDLKIFFKETFEENQRGTPAISSEDDSELNLGFDITVFINTIVAYRVLYPAEERQVYDAVHASFPSDFNIGNLVYHGATAQMSSYITLGLLSFRDGNMRVVNNQQVLDSLLNTFSYEFSALAGFDLDEANMSYLNELHSFLLSKPYDEEHIKIALSKVLE